MARSSLTGLLGVRPELRRRRPSGILSSTIASGVLTVEGNYPVVTPLPETSTTDTIDSIVCKPPAEAGDTMLLHVPATNTITVDDANINLGAATRAIAPGGSLLLVFDGTQWSEVSFLAASDNA